MADDRIEQFLDSLEEEETVQDAKPDVDQKKLGYALRQEKKRAKDLEKELDELRSFQERTLQEQKTNALRGAGLTEGQAKAFQAMYQEVNDEALASFRAEVLGVQPEAPAEEPTLDIAPETIEAPGLGPVNVPTSAAAPQSKQYTANELARILLEDPARADRLVAEGKFKQADWADLYRPDDEQA